MTKVFLKMSSTLILLFTMGFFLNSCSHHSVNDMDKVEQNVSIGKDLNANRFSNIYFSAQPKNHDYKKLKEQGFKTIINLRQTKEYNEKAERKFAKQNGFNYYNVPLNMAKPLTDEYISSVTKKIMAHRKDGKLLVHCSSGNRVGVWLGGHFKKDHKYSNEESVKIAKNLGLNNPKAEKYLRNYLK